MKVNFEQIEIFTGLDRTHTSIVNLKNQVANELYMRGNGLPCHALALKIYNSQGEIELADEESALLLNFADIVFTPNIIDSLHKVLDNPTKQ